MLTRLFRLLQTPGAVWRVIRGPEKLFDREYYLAWNADVAASGVNPLLHFLVFGGLEGRKPNPIFDSDFYSRQYPDVAASGANPLLHYLKRGAAEGRRPHPLFEPESTGSAGPSGALDQFLQALAEPSETILYKWWVRREARVPAPTPTLRPQFSVLVSVAQPRCEWLQEAVAAVRAQEYPHWELCICNASAEERVVDCLENAARADGRIRVLRVPSEARKSDALNQAAAVAGGDYLVLLDQHDRLVPHALGWLAAGAPADVIYSDEDRLDADGTRRQPLFKPDWSPNLLLSCMYLGRVLAISRAVWESAGGVDPDHEDALEYDFALRLAEKAASVQHVPRVLCSRRAVEPFDGKDSSASRCLLGAIRRRGIPAEVESGPRPGTFRLRWKVIGEALASVIICSRSPKLLERCLESLLTQTAYRNREVIVVHHTEGNGDGLEAVTARYGAQRIVYPGPFHFSRMNNLGAEAAKGEVLVFLNDDTEVLDSSWLERLAGQVQRPDVGIAGAQLLYPTGTLQHGGVAIGVGAGCAHIGRNTTGQIPHWPWLDLTRDVSAVTGACLAIRSSVFREVGGFSEQFPVNYNDIDLCMRVREAGYGVIYEAGAVLRHYECQTRRGVVTPAEHELWRRRWHEREVAGDPFYSPNLTRHHEDLSLGDPAGDGG